MSTLTYPEAYNKIIDAYFKNEIKPLHPEFCFCGTLCGNDKWCTIEYKSKEHSYSKMEYSKMETALLIPLIPFGAGRIGTKPGQWGGDLDEDDKGFEDALFIGMSNALDVLKSIHEQRSEIINEPIKFKKRDLLQV